MHSPSRLLAQAPPLPFVLALLLAWVAHRRWPVRVPRGRGLGAIALACGAALDGWSIEAQNRFGSSPLPSAERSVLVTSGPYALSRNPIYLAHTLVTLGLGLALWRTGWGLLAAGAGWWATDRWTVPFEEGRLAEAFGAEYEVYSRRVGRWWGGLDRRLGPERARTAGDRARRCGSTGSPRTDEGAGLWLVLRGSTGSP